LIRLHHLNNSRSQRILWLLEELGAPYELVVHQRDPDTLRAPDALRAVHPLGRSPVITDGALTMAESGAIIDYIIRRYGGGRLAPPTDTMAYDQYIEWLHYAEGSAFFAIAARFLAGWFHATNPEFDAVVMHQIDDQMRYVEGRLEGRDFLVGNDLTGADIQNNFIFEFAAARGSLGDYPNIRNYMKRMQARAAYRRAIEIGGPYELDKLFRSDTAEPA
jgi:glutathione S-transferase